VDQSTGKSFQSTILFSPQEEMVYSCIKSLPQTSDDIVNKINLPPHTIFSRLTLLEMKGLVRCGVMGFGT
jgi:predicted transcriptional regulator